MLYFEKQNLYNSDKQKLQNSLEKSAEILFAILKLYENTQFSLLALRKYGFHYTLPIQFYDNPEAYILSINDELKQNISEILLQTDSNGCRNKDLLKTFVNLFEALKMPFPQQKNEKIITKFEQGIMDVLQASKPPEKISHKKLPKFCGAEILEKENKNIAGMILGELRKIKEKYENDDIKNIINNIENDICLKGKGNIDKNEWHVPSFWHVTSYYIGKKSGSTPDSEYLKNFTELSNIGIRCDALVYIPGKVIFSIGTCPSLTLHSSYKVPSIVWLLNSKGSMGFARDACEQLFESYKNLRNIYTAGFFNDIKPYCENVQIEVCKEIYECYVVKTLPKLTISAETKFFYN